MARGRWAAALSVASWAAVGGGGGDADVGGGGGGGVLAPLAGEPEGGWGTWGTVTKDSVEKEGKPERHPLYANDPIDPATVGIR